MASMIMSKSDKRTPRHRLNPSDCSVRVTERDLDIFGALCKMRFLTTKQAARLFFNDSSWAANKRLRRLFNARLVKVWVRSLSQDNIYSITRRGLSVLDAEDLDLSPKATYPRGLDRNLDHLLAINQVRIALALGLPRIGAEINWWRSDWELRTPGKRRIIPDAFFVIQWTEKTKDVFALELDNNTRSVRGFIKKILGYSSLITSGKGLYGINVFMVLVVGQDPKWTERYRLTLSQTRMAVRVWFTTMDAIEKEGAAGAIWNSENNEKRLSLREAVSLPYGKEAGAGRSPLFSRT